jgi:hypothetical protein
MFNRRLIFVRLRLCNSEPSLEPIIPKNSDFSTVKRLNYVYKVGITSDHPRYVTLNVFRNLHASSAFSVTRNLEINWKLTFGHQNLPGFIKRSEANICSAFLTLTCFLCYFITVNFVYVIRIYNLFMRPIFI